MSFVRPGTSWPRRLLISGLLLIFVVLCVAYNAALPLFEAPDEGAHYIYVDYIASNRALPSMDALPSHEVSQPPLYYLLGAPLISWIDRSDFSLLYRPNPGLENGIVNDHLPQERAFPPTGVTLAIRILRFFSTFLGVLTVVFIYATVKNLFRRDDVALVALAVTAFNPKFLHMSSQFNNDIAVACAAALSLWIASRIMMQPKPPSSLSLLMLGASVGLATAAKYSGMALAAPAAFVVAWCAARPSGRADIDVASLESGTGASNSILTQSRFRRVAQAFVKWGALCTLGFVLTGGWLLLYNTVRYGNPLAATQFERAHALGIRPIPLSLNEIVDRLPMVLTSYWGEFGHGVQFPVAVDQVMLVVVAVALVGLVIAAVRRELPAELSVLLVLALVTFAAFIVWMRNQTGTENSRLLAPAFALVSACAAAGLLAWFPLRFRWNAALGLSVLGVIGGTVGLFLSLVPGYAMPQYLTEQQVAALPAQGAIAFDNGIELVNASLSTSRVNPSQELAISVYWSAIRPITDVYRAVVELRDEQDHSLGRMTTLPLGGRFATTQLQVGRVFRDDYRVQVSDTQRSVAHVFVGWYQQRPPFGVSHVRANGAASVQVGQVKVRGLQPPAVAPEIPFSSTFGGVIGLEGYSMDGGALTLYWRSLAVTPQDYTAFVHVVDANGKTVAQADAPVAYPISFWDPGEQIVDVRHVADMGPAVSIQVGLYDPASGQRQAAVRPDGTLWPDNAVVLRAKP